MTAIHIGMPLYNAEAFVEAAVGNLLRQTFSDFTLFISDNASTDRTGEIVRGLAAKDSRIVYYRQSENIGAVRNFDFVLAQAKAPYVVFAAHDDQWSDDYLERLYTQAKADARISLAVPRVVLTFADGQPDITLPVPDHAFKKNHFLRVLSLLHWVNGCWFYGLYRREALIEAMARARRFNYVWAVDLVSITPFILNDQIAADNEAVFYHHDTGSSYKLYRPVTYAERKMIYLAFMAEMKRALCAANLPMWFKLLLIPRMLIYTGHHTCKLRRIIRTRFFPRAEERNSPPRKLTVA